MRKHFRLKHVGREIQVTVELDDDLERRVEELLKESAVNYYETSDEEVLAWLPPEALAEFKWKQKQVSAQRILGPST